MHNELIYLDPGAARREHYVLVSIDPASPATQQPADAPPVVLHDVAPSGEADTELRLAAVSALYQADKSDASSIFNVSMAMMGIGAAYIIGAVGYSYQFGQGELTWPVVLFSAVPLWLIASFHSLLALNGMAHGVSVQILENAIYEYTHLDQALRKYVGSRIGDSIMDISVSNRAHQAASIFVYGGVAFLVVLYTIFVSVNAASHVALWLLLLAIFIYVLGATVVAGSWIAGFRFLGKANKDAGIAR